MRLNTFIHLLGLLRMHCKLTLMWFIHSFLQTFIILIFITYRIMLLAKLHLSMVRKSGSEKKRVPHGPQVQVSPP